LTTIVPAPGAIGPKSEGSGYTTAENNGCVFSKGTYKNGFKLTFTYSFTRNGDNGYVQPDYPNPNETKDPNDIRKISFVGNSGIKLGSFRGFGNGVTEVALLDTKAMVDRVSVTDSGIPYEKKEAFKHWTNGVGLEYAGVPDQTNGVVKFTSEFISGNNNFEKITQLMNAIGYGDTLNDDIYDYFTASSGSTAWWKFYATLMNNYDHCDPDGNEIEIYWKPDIDPITGQKLEIGKLEVYFKFKPTESEPKIRKKYYIKEGVKITGNTSATSPVTLDGRIYIQTHWGSGVTFKNLTISGYLPPVPPDIDNT
jgi:hypothetical protein